MLRSRFRSTLTCLPVLLAGCFRIEPIADEGPPLVSATFEVRDSPRLVERFRSVDAPALFAVKQLLVQGDRLYALVSEDSQGVASSGVFVFNLVDGDLRLERHIQPFDKTPAEVILLPGNPPFLAKADRWMGPLNATSTEVQFVDLTGTERDICASGKFAATKETWFIVGDVNGTSVHLREWSDNGFRTLETNDYNQWSVDCEIAADGEYAALLINSESGFQLLRHDPDTGESLVKLGQKMLYGRRMAVSVRGSGALCAWLTSSDAVAIFDGRCSLQFTFDDVVVGVGCLLSPRGAYVVVHTAARRRAVMQKQPGGEWTIGPFEECPGYQPKLVLFGERAWQFDVLQGVLHVAEIVD